MNDQGIPEKYDDVSPEWLDAALHSSGTITDQKVIGVSFEPLGPEFGRSSSLAIIRPSYNTTGIGPTSLFAKFVSTIQSNREFVEQWDVFSYEIEVYRSLGGKLPVPMPRFYFGASEQDSDLAVLMIELLSGNRTIDLPEDQRSAGLPPSTQRVALKPLAAMHSQWWNSTAALDELEWLRPWTGMNATSLITASNGFSSDDLRTAIRPYMSDDDLALYDEALRQLNRIETALASIPQTLCHGDFHAQNMLWDSLPEANSVVVVDWQLLNRGPAVLDLSYFLGITSAATTAADVITEQAQFYHSELFGGVNAVYPFEELLIGLAPAILDHIVRFQVFFSELDFALPNAAQFAGNLFTKLCNFGSAVGADDWLAN